MLKTTKYLLLSAVLLAGCSSFYTGTDDSAPVDLYEYEWELEGDLAAHDPSLIRSADGWFIFYTGSGIKVKHSVDGINWSHYGQVFRKPPGWIKEKIENVSTSIWAPDINYYRGKYYLFYSASTFGRNNSVIGLAVNSTLDKEDKDYKWQDLGPVIESGAGDSYNCIDPNLVIDRKGNPWLSFGSFWTGIKITPLDKKTLKVLDDKNLFPIAFRPGSNAVEAPYIIYREGYYYQFISFDSCCRGVNSTYNIVVGRSKEVNGQYTDKSGKSLLDGGGTLLKESDERWIGPGHCGVYTSSGTSILYHHAYDAQNNGFATLRIESLFWDDEGWPVLK